MNLLHVFPLKEVPKWALIGLAAMALILAVLTIQFVSSQTWARNQLAYLTFLNGEVNVSDGISETAASNGALIARSGRTSLKTGNGNANLMMQDGSFVIVDSDSTIEFPNPNEKDPNDAIAFNLVKGRALVVNEETRQTATQLVIGDNVYVRVFHATVGLEVSMDGKVRERVDCLAGQCLVNGVFLLEAGQNAQIGLQNSVHVTDGVLNSAWISLIRANRPGPALSTQFAGILPSITDTLTPINKTKAAEPAIPITGDGTLTSSPSSTVSMQTTISPTLTLTETLLPSSSPSVTFILIYTPLPTATLTPYVPPKTPVPSRTSTPGSTPPATPNPTPIPTLISTIVQTVMPTAVPTETLLPTEVPTPTIIPSPTNTPIPTEVPTLKPSPTHKPTKTPRSTNPNIEP